MRRYTTSAGTDRPRSRRGSAALTVLLLVQIAAAATLLGHLPSVPGSGVGPAKAAVAAPHVARLVATGPGAAPLLARLRSEMDEAIDAVVTFWGSDWPRQIDIVATVTDREFAMRAGDPARDWSGVAAVTVADRLDLDRGIVSGQLIVFAPGATAMSDAALRVVLRHELFHYAARAKTAADAPQWLTEGVADYVARPALTPHASQAIRPILPSDEDLTAGGVRGSAAYDQAWSFARFVAHQYGPAELRLLYLRACGPGHVPVPAAVRQTLGVDLDDLLAAWQRWLATG